MSISRAPAATEASISRMLRSNGLSPAGKPVETAATGMPDAAQRLDGGRHQRVVDAHRADRGSAAVRTPSASSRSARTGWRALAHSRRTLPGVSSPESVVRSMHVIARSSHAACHSFLTVRRPGSVAARRSTALRLTRTASTQSRSSAQPGLRSARWGVLSVTGSSIMAISTKGYHIGSTTVNVAPAPGRLMTWIVPPSASTIWRTIYRPRPSPP